MTPFLKGTSSSAFSMKNTHNQGGKSPKEKQNRFLPVQVQQLCFSQRKKNIWYQIQNFKVPVSGKCYEVLSQVRNIIPTYCDF